MVIKTSSKQNSETKTIKELRMRLLFPFEEIRPSQKDMLLSVEEALKKKNHLIIHAPTGLGKTIATLGPAVKYAIDNKKTIFFLTSRHTQHMIAIETLRMIADKYKVKIKASDIIGKKWMCLQAGIENLYSNEFADYCKKLVEDDKCEFYTNLKKSAKLTIKARSVIENLSKSINSTDEIIEECKEHKICPYYLSAELANDANVIIADYYYMFNPKIREAFLNRTQKSIEDCIIIIDEGHNLGNRIRDLQTSRLSSNILKRGIQEAKKFEHTHLIPRLVKIQEFLNKRIILGPNKFESELIIKKEDFIKYLNEDFDYEDLISDLANASEAVHGVQRQSYLSSISLFLESWKGDDTGFVRILSSNKSKPDSSTILSYRCLDPSSLTIPILEDCHSTIIMSGTLTPTSMYKDLLGFKSRTIERVYKSPFKEENKLNIIIPETSTKYERRNETEFEKIAEICAEITNAIPGNSAIFFPSYFMRDQIGRFFDKLTRKTTLQESPQLSKSEKSQLLEKFKKYKKTGAVLLGVASGSFGEGIDLPGDLLKGVLIVGLPLQRPDLETKSLIEYYDKKFGKGWDYGYLYPAFNKAIQSAGRCIRNETDRGVIVFIDERYIWPKYYSLFPKDWEFRATRNPIPAIDDFFANL